MIKNDDEWIIEGEEDLKDPFMCYCLMMKWTWEAEEDYIDQNESIVMPVPFIMWLNGRRYITNDQADELLHVEYLDLQKNVMMIFPTETRTENCLITGGNFIRRQKWERQYVSQGNAPKICMDMPLSKNTKKWNGYYMTGF